MKETAGLPPVTSTCLWNAGKEFANMYIGIKFPSFAFFFFFTKIGLNSL